MNKPKPGSINYFFEELTPEQVAFGRWMADQKRRTRTVAPDDATVLRWAKMLGYRKVARPSRY